MTPTTTVGIGISLRSNILEQLHKHFNELELFNDVPISTILDPRNLHFQDPVNCLRAIGKIKRLLIGLQNEQSAVETEPTTSSQLSISNNQSFDLWSYHKTVASLQIENRTKPVDQELNYYLTKPVVPINTNPLEAWDVIKSMHHNLFEVARTKLSIIAIHRFHRNDYFLKQAKF
ncbi:unnamed protein product [Macrosiphum euphorbiae]|uniref:Uncharacterized protein n=1 Tax=Macrosiphum euphorbiae TaxID=13131 RepID=A0AAV0WSN6_9HEMI|nr:unnamed protein product [Macrosiphum euphorbiae]